MISEGNKCSPVVNYGKNNYNTMFCVRMCILTVGLEIFVGHDIFAVFAVGGSSTKGFGDDLGRNFLKREGALIHYPCACVHFFLFQPVPAPNEIDAALE